MKEMGEETLDNARRSCFEELKKAKAALRDAEMQVSQMRRTKELVSERLAGSSWSRLRLLQKRPKKQRRRLRRSFKVRTRSLMLHVFQVFSLRIPCIKL